MNLKVPLVVATARGELLSAPLGANVKRKELFTGLMLLALV